MITRKEYLLQKLQEECMEVAQRASKAVLFGLNEVPSLVHVPSNTRKLNNAQMVMTEVHDLLGVLHMMWDEGILPLPIHDEVKAKKLKVEGYMAYSRKLGVLEPEQASFIWDRWQNIPPMFHHRYFYAVLPYTERGEKSYERSGVISYEKLQTIDPTYFKEGGGIHLELDLKRTDY